MAMRLIDPTGDSRMEAHDLAHRLGDLEGLRIGVLSNTKRNADALAMATAERFAARHGCRIGPMREKDSSSRPADPVLLNELAAECDFLVTAVGD